MKFSKEIFNAKMFVVLLVVMLSASSMLTGCFWNADEPTNYTITYELAGGTNAEANPATYNEEDGLITLADPTKAGYTFVGWTEGNTIADDATGDKTFTATWTLDTYNITYALNGGTNAEGNPTTYTVEDSEITLVAPTKANYDFAGWTEGNTIAAGSTGDKTFTATWTATDYTINYVLDGGVNDASNPATYNVESAEITLLDPTKTGYTFVAWTEGNTIAAGSTGDVTFTATWAVEVYNITYALDGGDDSTTGNPTTYTIEDAEITLVDPVKANYTFAGWTEGNTIASGSNGAKTFTATWTPVEFTITYNLDGGTNDAANPATYNVESGEITLVNPTKVGYTFVSWTEGNTIATGSTGAKTFTATWTATNYNISYVLNGGDDSTTGNPATYNVESDEITLVDPVRANYTFAGWTEGNTITAGTTGDLTFTAEWTPVEFTITYELNDGTNDASNPATYNVESETITLVAPTKVGYTFVNWTEGDTIATGSTGAKTFTANWAVVTYNITYVLNEGTNDGANVATYTVEDTNITLVDPTRAGYAFVNWTNAAQEVVTEINTSLATDMTLTANWAQTTTVTLVANGDGTVNVELNGEYTAGSVITVTATNGTGTFTNWTTDSADGTFTDANAATTTYTVTDADIAAGFVTLTANFI